MSFDFFTTVPHKSKIKKKLPTKYLNFISNKGEVIKLFRHKSTYSKIVGRISVLIYIARTSYLGVNKI